MQMEEQAREEKSTSEQLQEALGRLTSDQIRFVVARQEFPTDMEAAQSIGIKANTVYKWRHGGVPIDDAVHLMAADGVIVAMELRRRNLAKAMAVKVAGLDSTKEVTRQNVATEIIEWEMGKPMQKQEITGAAGGDLVFRVVYEDEPDSDPDDNAEAAA